MPEDNGNDQDSIPEIRKKLEAALAKIEELSGEVTTVKTENTSLKGTNVLHEAKLGHLSEKQRAAVLRMHEGDELTVESILSVADDLGYKPQAPGQTNPQGNGQGGQGGEGQQGQEGQPPAGAQAFIDMLQQAGINVMDPNVSQALDSMSRIDQANIAAQRPSSVDFITKMQNTKSKQELEALIMAEGAAHGMVHEFDID